jgi:hypothetical protein
LASLVGGQNGRHDRPICRSATLLPKPYTREQRIQATQVYAT